MRKEMAEKRQFVREKRPGIGGAVVFYTEEPPEYEEDPFMIIANGNGVRMDGRSQTLESQEDLQRFAKAVSDAWKDHMQLKPKLATMGNLHDV